MASMCDPVPIWAERIVAAYPAREHVADGIFANGQSGGYAFFFQPGAGGKVGFAEDDCG